MICKILFPRKGKLFPWSKHRKIQKQKTTQTGGFEYLVRAKGLEPSTSTLARLRSSQLSYARTAWHILT